MKITDIRNGFDHVPDIDVWTIEDVIASLKMRTDGRKAAEFARESGVSVGYIYDCLKRRYPPGPKMLKALGVHKVVYYSTVIDGIDGADRADDEDIQVALPDESTPI